MTWATGRNQGNPFLSGPYAPVGSESLFDSFEVEGEIPSDLSGTYVRNGPNPRFAPKGRHHWFDGDGMLHAARLHDGKLQYRNRYVRTAGIAEETKNEGALWTGIMERIDASSGRPPYKDTANTDVLVHKGELLALWYISGLPYRLDPASLENRGPAGYGQEKPVRVAAHAKVDERTGELLFFDYGRRAPYLWYGEVDSHGQLTNRVPVELPGPRLPHDMAFTEHYSILMDLPVFPDPSVKDHWTVGFHPELPSRFAVIPRGGSSIRWFESSACYIYHTVGAWEEGEEIVLVGCRLEEPLAQPRPEHGKWAGMLSTLTIDARLWEWRFNLETGQCSERQLDDKNAEFPTVNANVAGQKLRYSYHQQLDYDPALRFAGLVKYDLETGSSSSYSYGEGRYGSEAPFAPRNGSSSEDDGYVLSFVHDLREDRSELLILDAQNISSGPLARVFLPQRVPAGFHACWAPTAA